MDANVILALRFNNTTMFFYHRLAYLLVLRFMDAFPNAWRMCVLSNGFCGLNVTLSRGFSQDKAERMIDKWQHLCFGSLFANAHYK